MTSLGQNQTAKKNFNSSVRMMSTLLLFLSLSVFTVSAQYSPNTFGDPTWTTLDNATGQIDGGTTVSLRSAITAADNNGGVSTIDLSTGNYLLTRGHIIFGNRLEQITITGDGPSNTSIDGGLNDRIFLLNPTGLTDDVITILEGIKFQNGRLSSDFYGGGAIAAGGGLRNTLTVTNCTFDNNVVPLGKGSGGAINMIISGNLTVDNCTFTNNHNNDADGGAIYSIIFDGTGYPLFSGDLVVSNSTFIGNTTVANGGAIAFSSQPLLPGQTYSVLINKNTFRSNTATGYGGAISANNAGATSTPLINYNRFVGNVSTASASTSGLHYVYTPGNVNAENNWWGCNTGPTASPCNRAAATGAPAPGDGSLDASPWLQLKTSASPNTICLTEDNSANTSTVTASFLENSDNQPVGSSRVDLQACKLEYSIVSPK